MRFINVHVRINYYFALITATVRLITKRRYVTLSTTVNIALAAKLCSRNHVNIIELENEARIIFWRQNVIARE